MASTFDSDVILDQWKDQGKWPEIHGKIGWAAKEYLKEERVLDLCCAFGLLGDRILHTCPRVKYVLGVDGDVQSIAKGTAAGVRIPLVYMVINRSTINNLYQLITDHQITSIVARRAFPELFGADPEFGVEVAAKLVKLGIKEILVEGRVVSPRSSNLLKDLDSETQMLGQSYEVVAGVFNCAYLLVKNNGEQPLTDGQIVI